MDIHVSHSWYAAHYLTYHHSCMQEYVGEPMYISTIHIYSVHAWTGPPPNGPSLGVVCMQQQTWICILYAAQRCSHRPLLISTDNEETAAVSMETTEDTEACPPSCPGNWVNETNPAECNSLYSGPVVLISLVMWQTQKGEYKSLKQLCKCVCVFMYFNNS